MKRVKDRLLVVAASTVIAVFFAGTALVAAAVNDVYKVVAENDLGMHCACPTFEGFLILPPFNTIRAQVFKKGCTDPIIIGSDSGLTVSFAMVENTDAILQSDPYFMNWIAFGPKMFPGYQPVVNGKVVGITGTGLAGAMKYDPTKKVYIAQGIPAYAVRTGTSADTMIDPLGGPNRDPFLTANVMVKDSTGTVLATTSTVVPIAFGGCCTCHLNLAQANGYPRTPAGSFAYLGKLHGQNSSKIDFNYLDPDGDGVPGPIRCSMCHWDPAMGDTAAGEGKAPGLPLLWPNYKILPGASFTSANIKVSQYSFSDVLHRFHVKDTIVLSQYDANIAKNCYDCHPGNNVNCYRDAHKGKTAIWCTDCHGDLNQRVATNQLKQPWMQSTLPSCDNPSPGITSVFKCHTGYGSNATPGAFGKYLNSVGHMGGVLCSTCHGEPHALNPSTLAKDNAQHIALQGFGTFPTGKDASYALGVCNFCHTGKTNTWGIPKHLPNLFPAFQLNADDFKHDSFLGEQHINKYKHFGEDCTTCHDGTKQLTPPWIGDKRADMQTGSCETCHFGDSEKFVSQLNTGTKVYTRCGDCHKVLGETAWEDYSPTGPLGNAHINMYNNFGTKCTNCHTGTCQPVPPRLADQRINTMKPGHACSDCHPGGGKPDLFITHMPLYARCTACHPAP